MDLTTSRFLLWCSRQQFFRLVCYGVRDLSAFALFQRDRITNIEQRSPTDWYIAVIFYGVSAAGALFVRIPHRSLSVADPSGILWEVSDITGAYAIVSIFVTGAFALIAAARVAKEQ